MLLLSAGGGGVKRGAFDQLISIQQVPTAENEYGEQKPTGDPPVTLEQGLARVRYGPAGEKREAAQETGHQTATFELYPTPTLLAVTLRDKLNFDGSDWDIVEVAPLDRRTLRFTATRAR